MKYSIEIPGNTISSKNHKQIVFVNRGYGPKKPALISSKPYSEWASMVKAALKNHALIGANWKYPLIIHFHFYRKTGAKFDFVNMAQGPLDLLQQLGIIADDDMNHVIPGRFTWSLDKHNPRLVIQIEENSNGDS